MPVRRSQSYRSAHAEIAYVSGAHMPLAYFYEVVFFQAWSLSSIFLYIILYFNPGFFNSSIEFKAFVSR